MARGWPRSLATLCAAALAAGPLGCEDGPTGRPSLLLVTIDTLRADRLGAWGYPLPTSPRIDALAASGVRFRDATVQWPKTWPSVATLLTGTHPWSHRVTLHNRRLAGRATTLAERLALEGYVTAGIVANVTLRAANGYDQGFDVFLESWEGRRRESHAGPLAEPQRVKEYTNATIVTDLAIDWLGSRPRGRPFFLWVHYIDPHGPYEPPESVRGLFEAEHPPDPVTSIERLPSYQRLVDPSGTPVLDLGRYRARYDELIRYTDAEIGRLLDAVRERGLEDRTLRVLTADHGESLGEHDYYLDHGRFSYQVNAHVPLVFSWPGVIDADRTVDWPVGLVDVTPTVLELLGVALPPGLEGRSLAPLVLGEPGAQGPPAVYMASGRDPERPQLTVRRGRWKLIRVDSPRDRRRMTGDPIELYDLAADPGELDERSAREPGVVAELLPLIDGVRARAGIAANPGPPGAAPSRAEREMLRQLGYLEPAEAPEPGDGAPSTGDRGGPTSTGEPTGVGDPAP